MSSDISRITMLSEQSCDGEPSQIPSPGPPGSPVSSPGGLSGGGAFGGGAPGSGSVTSGSGAGQSGGISMTASQQALPPQGPLPSGFNEQMVKPSSPVLWYAHR